MPDPTRGTVTVTAAEDLRRWLDAGAELAYNDGHAAAIALLDTAGLLADDDIVAFIETATVAGRDGQTVRGAWVDWAGLAHAIDTAAIGPDLDGDAVRLLYLAASLAHGRPVDLRAALFGLDPVHARAVVAAVARATGLTAPGADTDRAGQ